MGCNLLRLVPAELAELVPQLSACEGKDFHSQQSGVAGAVDPYSCHGHTRWHLHYGVERIHAV